MRDICVYCGSRNGADPEFAKAADEIGAGLAKLGLGLVYGAGDIGLMGRVADAALKNGASVLGVIPEHLAAKEVSKSELSELIVVDTMHERKMMMFERSDAFIALPGGPGTLDEVIELLTWRQLGLHDRPVYILNIKGYWDPLVALLEKTVEMEFAEPGFLDYFETHDSVKSLLAAL